jgi:hypothetical protein
MLSGADPFASMNASALIRAKLSAGDDQVALPGWVLRSHDTRVAGLADLVRWCTRFDRTQR